MSRASEGLSSSEDTNTVPGELAAAANDETFDVRPSALSIVRRWGLQTIPLPTHGELTIGRGSAADVSLADVSVSRQHCLLTFDEHEVRLVDLGSRNGTWVDGERLEPRQARVLRCDQLLRIGSLLGVSLSPRQADVVETVTIGELERRTRVAIEEEAAADVTVIHLRATDGPLELDTARVLLLPHIPACVAVARFGSRDVRALSVGAPFTAVDEAVRELRDRFSRADAKLRIVAEHSPAMDAAAGDELPTTTDSLSTGVIVADPVMEDVYRLAGRMAKGTISVLIHGETGVGKESVAEAIHRLSPRADKPFLRLNCAAFSHTLLESELFGHEKGAFTGANATKAGLLESAHGGTVFLDEVGELSQSAQAKLLRCLEDGTVMRVGAVRPREIDVRFVAATNRDLEEEVARGAFREDLFYRIAAATIWVPPLRDRVCEIEPLARSFASACARELGHTSKPSLTPEALQALASHAWPGNVRELRNAIERAVLLAGEQPICEEHLPLDRLSRSDSGQRPYEGIADSPTHSDDPRQRIIEALRETGGNQTKAARMLGISRVTLAKRLDAYGIPRPRK